MHPDICRLCGETADNPKIIPSLPFYYLEDTSTYQNGFNNKSNPDCSGSGPDVVFQYTATADMVDLLNKRFLSVALAFSGLYNPHEFNLRHIKNLDLICRTGPFVDAT